MEDNKALLEALMSLSIQGAKEELQHRLDLKKYRIMLSRWEAGQELPQPPEWFK